MEDDVWNEFLHKDPIDDMNLEESVRYWALKTNQDHQSINLIMNVIRKKTNGLLPKDARTLLHTSRETAPIVDIEGGKYWHYGIRRCLTEFFRYLISIHFHDMI